MIYDLRNLQQPVLPLFKPGTAGTLLFPRPNTLIAGMQVPCRISRGEDPDDGPHRPLPLIIQGINLSDDPNVEAAVMQLVMPGDWLVVAQPGYAYVLRSALVRTPEEEKEGAPVVRERKAEFSEGTRPTVASIQAIWQHVHGPDVPVYGLRRTAPAYVYGEIDPRTRPGKLLVFGGESNVDSDVWVDKRLFLISEADPKRSCPRIVPMTYLTREYQQWKRADGSLIEDFGAIPGV